MPAINAGLMPNPEKCKEVEAHDLTLLVLRLVPFFQQYRNAVLSL
jgi:hypothetical protein